MFRLFAGINLRSWKFLRAKIFSSLRLALRYGHGLTIVVPAARYFRALRILFRKLDKQNLHVLLQQHSSLSKKFPIKEKVSGKEGQNSMLAKCANPACSTPLIYLREGKIFMMDNAGSQKAKMPVKSPGHVEHFWLCGPCAEHLTLIYHPGSGISVVPKEPRTRHAVAS